MKTPIGNGEIPRPGLSNLGWGWLAAVILLIAPLTYLLLSTGNGLHQADFDAESAKLPMPTGCSITGSSTQTGGINAGFEKTTNFSCGSLSGTDLSTNISNDAEQAGYQSISSSYNTGASNSPTELIFQNSCCQATYELDPSGLTLTFRAREN